MRKGQDTATDDRGHRVWIPSERFFTQRTRDHREQYLFISSEIARKSKRSVMVYDIGRVLFAAGVFFVLGIIFYVSKLSSQSYAALGVGVLLVLMAYLRPKILRAELKKLRRRNEYFRKAAQSHQKCFLCAYEMQGIPAEPDGCTVCPECGAAWRMACPKVEQDKLSS